MYSNPRASFRLQDGITPLHLAAMHDSAAACFALLAHGADAARSMEVLESFIYGCIALSLFPHT